jgi:prepilin-type N-terminal cleavage/methylation domain-containing protein
MIKKGFTLVEMLIYMGLLTIFLAVIGNIFFSIIDLQLESQATSSVSESGRYLLSRISYDVRRAQSITTPASPGLSSPLWSVHRRLPTPKLPVLLLSPTYRGGLVDALTG